MSNVLVFAETRGTALRKTALESVTAARALADATGGGEVHALVAGPPGVAAAAEALGQHGADVVVVVEHAGLANFDRESIASTIAARAQSQGYRAILLGFSAQGRDIGPRVAAKLDLPIATDVTDIQAAGDAIVVKHPAYANKVIVTLQISGPCAVIAMRPSAVTATPAPRIKAPENFKLVEDLAAAFGNAAVGATRAVTDDGWRPHSDQIGQTGRQVSPQLYVAVGISGAIQHLAGMRSSKTIVAINKDKEAPIFKVADYGIVGDVLEILPALTAAVREAKAGH